MRDRAFISSLLRLSAVAIMAMGMTGCQEESKPNPEIKVEKGKTIEESVNKAKGGGAVKEPAPLQRVKGGPE